MGGGGFHDTYTHGNHHSWYMSSHMCSHTYTHTHTNMHAHIFFNPKRLFHQVSTVRTQSSAKVR